MVKLSSRVPTSLISREGQLGQSSTRWCCNRSSHDQSMDTHDTPTKPCGSSALNSIHRSFRIRGWSEHERLCSIDPGGTRADVGIGLGPYDLRALRTCRLDHSRLCGWPRPLAHATTSPSLLTGDAEGRPNHEDARPAQELGRCHWEQDSSHVVGKAYRVGHCRYFSYQPAH